MGMGRDLAEAHPEVAELWIAAEEIVQTPLRRICWEGPEQELTATQNAQPAILLHSFAVWSLVGPQLDGPVVVAAGHSLGEFTAHLLAGTFSFEDALRLVRARGELMASSGESRSGTMAAVLGLQSEAVARICASVEDGVVVLANLNAPGQIVISGDVVAVQEAAIGAEAEGARRVVVLPVSGAFHSPLMESAAAGLREALERVAWADPFFPVVANATASPVTDAASARRTLLAQLTSAVRWEEGVSAMRETEPERWLEIGPGRVLGGLLRRIDRSLTVSSVGDAESVDEFTRLEAKGSA